MVLLVLCLLAAALVFVNLVLFLFRGTRIDLSFEPPALADHLDRIARC
jgi:hypothetical protein